jgi:hypothetical protein
MSSSSTALAESKTEEEKGAERFEKIDALDEEQIIAELKCKVIED